MRKPYERQLRGKSVWYILHEGRQVWLGRFKEEAHNNWKRLKADRPILRPRKEVDDPAEPTVQDLVGEFLDHQHTHKSQSTYDWYLNFLRSFCEFEGAGRLKVSRVKKTVLQRWLDVNRRRSKRPWNENTAHDAAIAVISAFNHAVDQERISVSPFKGFKKPPATPRDCELSPEEWKSLIDAVDGEFEDAIRFMRLAGARPMECRNAEKRHFHSKIPALIFPKEEAKGKKRERVIHLPAEALLIIQKLCLRHPTGKLFRHAGGEPWTKDGMGRRFRRLRVKLGIPHLMPYSMRHTFATDAVINGVDSIVLMKLMGHTSTKMLEHVYAKHERRHEFMKKQVAKAIEGVC